MSKYHINAQGVPSPCRATKGNCPFGGPDGNENHFDTIAEAQAYVDAANAKEYGILPNSSSSFRGDRTIALDEKFNEIVKGGNLKEVRETLDSKVNDSNWEGMSDYKVLSDFVQNYGGEEATKETVDFFDNNSAYASTLYSKVYSFESGNWGKMNTVPYEETFAEWTDANVRSVEDFEDTVFGEDNHEAYYKNNEFISKINEFYDKQVIDVNSSRRKFTSVLSNFIKDLHEEERANIALSVLEN